MENKEKNIGRIDKFELSMKVPDDFINPFKIAKREAKLKAMNNDNNDNDHIINTNRNNSHIVTPKNDHNRRVVIGSKPPGWVDIKPDDMDTQEFMRRYDEQVWKSKSEIAKIWEVNSQTPQLYTPSTSPTTTSSQPSVTPQENPSYPLSFTSSYGPDLPSLIDGNRKPLFPPPLPELDTIDSSSPQDLLLEDFVPGVLSSNDLIVDNMNDSQTTKTQIKIYESTSQKDCVQAIIGSQSSILVPSRPYVNKNAEAEFHEIKTDKSEINPFDRSCKLTQTTSSRRRWGHCFPVSNKGQ